MPLPGGPASGQNPQPGPTVNPIGGNFTPRGNMPVPGLGTSDSNNHAIALAASIGGGESAVYYFDTKATGLGLRVSYGGGKSFFVMYGPARKRQRKGLGKYGNLEDGRVSLAHGRHDCRCHAYPWAR